MVEHYAEAETLWESTQKSFFSISAFGIAIILCHSVAKESMSCLFKFRRAQTKMQILG